MADEILSREKVENIVRYCALATMAIESHEALRALVDERESELAHLSKMMDESDMEPCEECERLRAKVEQWKSLADGHATVDRAKVTRMEIEAKHLRAEVERLRAEVKEYKPYWATMKIRAGEVTDGG